MPWITNLEQTINWKLIGKNNRRQFFKLNVNALMRGDSKSRAEYYTSRFQMGSLSINEIKAFEDENGIGPDGDKYFMQMNMAIVDNIVNPPEPPAPALATPAPLPNVDDDEIKNLVESTVGKILFNVGERINRARKKGDERTLKLVVGSVLINRSDYFYNTINESLLPHIGNDANNINDLVTMLVNTINDRYFVALDELKSGLVRDFTAFCVTITKSEAEK